MTQSQELNDAIVENATGPKRVQGEKGSIENHSIQDQIAAATHVATTEAARTPNRGLRFTKVIPAGPS